MAISSEGNAYLQVSLQLHLILKIHIIKSSLRVIDKSCFYVVLDRLYLSFFDMMCIITLCSAVQESQFWKLYKEDQPACAVVMRTAAGLVYLLACLLEPFMPSFSLEVIEPYCK